MRKYKNAVSAARARQLAQDSYMKPKEWEKAVKQILKVNGWKIWRDKDRATPEENRRRQRDHPDYECRKRFGPLDKFPRALARACDYPDMPAGSDIVIWGFIEAKTGSGKPSPGQAEWIADAQLCPGMFALCVWPTDRAKLVELLGGVEVIR